MDTFTFVHCADLHLDSPFEGIHQVEPDIAAVLRNATFQAFENVVNLAVDEGADFLIVAGDVYDGMDRSLRAQLRFRDGLARAASNGIKCFIAHGNHDPLSGWEAHLKMPEGVHRFGEELERIAFTRGGVELARIQGISHRSRGLKDNLALGFEGTRDGPYAIGVLHCNVGGDPNHHNYAPCSMEDLLDRGIGYWALGHVHAHRVLRRESPCVVYPGNTQGRSVKEPGSRGCCLVRVDSSGGTEVRFHPTDAVRWFVGEVDITDMDTVDDLLDALANECEGLRAQAEGRAGVVRLRITGRGDLHRELSRVEPDRDLAGPLRQQETGRPHFMWVESVRLETAQTVDIPKRRAVGDFVGEFLRTVQGMRERPDAAEAIHRMLSNRREHRVIQGQLEALSPQDLAELLNEAEALGLDCLLKED